MRRRVVTAAVYTSVGLWCAPATASIHPVRGLLGRRLSSLAHPAHVALTFDDGPEPVSTPRVLDALAALGVHATFFVLGSRVERAPDLTRDIVVAGHELGVHGWDHRCVARRAPTAAIRDLLRTRDLITATTGCEPRWYRPAYGVATTPVLWAAGRAGLSTVLWTGWGRDWVRGATPASVASRVTAGIRGGAVLLLHDAPAGRADVDAWRATVGALPLIAARCREQALSLGTLGEHCLPQVHRG